MGATDEERRAADEFYIVATDTSHDERTRVLKQDETFAVFDRYGDVVTEGLGQHGLYHQGTRFLSRYRLALYQHRPMLLGSTISTDNKLLLVDLTNPDMRLDGHLDTPRGTIHLQRKRFLWESTAFEELTVHNYGLTPLKVQLAFEFDADFADVFEVRGMQRAKRGVLLEPQLADGGVVLRYCGLDQQERRTRLQFSPPPTALTAARAQYALELRPQESAVIEVQVGCEVADEDPAPRRPFDDVLPRARRSVDEAARTGTRATSSNEQFNDWLARSMADIHLMVTSTPYGPYPYAGIPWYNAPFGRDGLITALETLWVDPRMARGVLAYLAATQARRVNAHSDAEPGKILHEARKGEMAMLEEVPFRQYYGTVDATPLFVLLAGAYYQCTGDLEFVRDLWPNVEAALGWIDRHGDHDGDGFVEYRQATPTGLVNQGWKDSHDAVSHHDGQLAEGAIALCEVQGYVYAAKQAAAGLARALGHVDLSDALKEQAERLYRQFDAAFWSDRLGFYALALDGSKRRCEVAASNAGQCMFTGIVPPERVPALTGRLMDRDFFAGWGIRTLSANEVRYNPMSYHNGSIWPHDNALIAAGFARYGLKRPVLSILEGLFEASLQVDLRRLPELISGFHREQGAVPTNYPTACAPQAWASGSVFSLLQSALGLTLDAPNRRLVFYKPALPAWLDWVTIRALRVGDAVADVELVRHHDDDVGTNVVVRSGELEVIIRK